LADLGMRIVRCVQCPLHEKRNQAVPGEGDPTADVMFVGEAPGEREDLEGRPFCGRSGRFFDEVLSSVGLSRREVFVTSSVKCRPPGNRNPRAEELATCRELWLLKQIEIVNPHVVVLLGKVAVKSLLDLEQSLVGTHGAVMDRNDRRYLVTYHPAAGMRFPRVRAAMMEDFCKLASFLA
jgi:uracil-DNA glycosylase family 4